MSVNGIYIGWVIKIDYEDLAEALKLDIESIEDIKDYLEDNKVNDLELDCLGGCHIEDNENIVYFGLIEKIGNDWGLSKLEGKENKIRNILTNHSFHEVCFKMFNEYPTLMTIVDGCRDCT